MAITMQEHTELRVQALHERDIPSRVSIPEAVMFARESANALLVYNGATTRKDYDTSTLERQTVYTGFKMKPKIITALDSLSKITNVVVWYSKDDTGKIIFNSFGFTHEARLAKALYTHVHRAFVGTVRDYTENNESHFLGTAKRAETFNFMDSVAVDIKKQLTEVYVAMVTDPEYADGIATLEEKYKLLSASAQSRFGIPASQREF